MSHRLQTLIEQKQDHDLRIWIPACATGEEAYSIAIIVKEILLRLDIDLKVTIFATDVSNIAVESARNKTYNYEQTEGLTQDYLQKYFDQKNSGFRPVKEIRDMIIFSKHDIIKDPPFSNLDLISCRNLLIYFNSDLQRAIINTFHYSLKLGGILFLGQSETVGNVNTMFSILHNKNKIYKKTSEIAVAVPHNIHFLKNFDDQTLKTHKKKSDDGVASIENSINQALLCKYGTNGVVIDGRNYQILYYKGDTSAYIAQPKGVSTQDIFKLIQNYIKLDLRASLNEAKKVAKPVTSKKIIIPSQKSTEYKSYVELTVLPLDSNSFGENCYFVGFEQKRLEKYLAKTTDNAANVDEIAILEDELASLKERLQITIEELETSNEELQSTNEELQSTNEELQSTNEELETSNEELQSTNEELQTVNDELTFKNDELEFTQIAFNNVLASIKTDILIIDSNLNILKFTSGINKFFDLTKSSVANFSSVLINANIDLPNLLDDLKLCLRENKEVGYEISLGKKMFWFRIKQISVIGHNRVKEKGLVLSFLDRTELFEKDKMIFNQSKLAAMGEMIGAIAHQWRQPLNAININIQLLEDDFEDNLIDKEYIKKFIDTQIQSINFLSHTIDDFRSFFKVDKEKSKMQIRQTVQSVFDLIYPQYKSNNITMQIQGESFTYEGYANELKQALLNILNNSKDAIVENKIAQGVVRVTLDKTHKTIYVEDNGGGVDAKILDRIFEPYFTTKEESLGTGIGLHMTKLIVEDHLRGKLKAYNVKSGLCLEIKLP